MLTVPELVMLAATASTVPTVPADTVRALSTDALPTIPVPLLVKVFATEPRITVAFAVSGPE